MFVCDNPGQSVRYLTIYSSLLCVYVGFAMFLPYSVIKYELHIDASDGSCCLVAKMEKLILNSFNWFACSCAHTHSG